MFPKTLCAASVAISFSVGAALAQTSVTDPVGFNRVACPAGTDTTVSIPFIKAPLAFQGKLNAAPVVASGSATLTPSGTVSWTAGQFTAKPHYVRFLSGAKAGMWYDVTASTANTLTIDLAGDNLAGVAANDQFTIVEHWTLDGLFPPASQTTFEVSPAITADQRKTELVLPNLAQSGVNLSKAGPSYVLLASGWVDAATGAAAGGTVLSPGGTFTIRQQNGAAASSFQPAGLVLMAKDIIPLSTASNTMQDNYIALSRPIPVALKDAGLDATVFISSTNHLVIGRKDELYVVDQSATGAGRNPKVYYKVGTTWYRDGSGDASTRVADDDIVFKPSEGVTIRKVVSPTASTAFWSNTATY